ncbi:MULTISPECIES: hypothetical protein [Paraburkholderia]|nr:MULTISPECIES: hypothetical protein [Paraburkholderia]MCX4165469.1 hypothetical protein [Paraburkholderia megapolitana]
MFRPLFRQHDTKRVEWGEAVCLALSRQAFAVSQQVAVDQKK